MNCPLPMDHVGLLLSLPLVFQQCHSLHWCTGPTSHPPPAPNAVSHTPSGTCLAQSASANCRVSLQVSPIFLLEKITLCWAWGLIFTTQHLAGQAEVGGLPKYKASLDYREKHCPKPKMTETKQKKQADTHPKEMDNDNQLFHLQLPFQQSFRLYSQV